MEENQLIVIVINSSKGNWKEALNAAVRCLHETGEFYCPGVANSLALMRKLLATDEVFMTKPMVINPYDKKIHGFIFINPIFKR